MENEIAHCPDCCCGMSWLALGITCYTGKSIPEHIQELRAETARLRKRVEELSKPVTDKEKKLWNQQKILRTGDFERVEKLIAARAGKEPIK